jgi:anti-anti-sigma factor
MPNQLFSPCSKQDRYPVIKITARVLRGEDLRGLSRRLLREVQESGRQAVFLDLAQVERPTASGLGQLVTLHRKLQTAGVGLALCNVGPLVFEAVEVTGLTKLLDVRPQ